MENSEFERKHGVQLIDLLESGEFLNSAQSLNHCLQKALTVFTIQAIAT